MKNFISVEEARALVKENTQTLSSIRLSVSASLDYTLAEDVMSPIDMPAFDQSAMDGYALRFSDLADTKSLPVSGESFAGLAAIFELQPQTAARIFTGAPLPHGADTVVMQEHVTRSENSIVLNTDLLTEGLHVRKRGAEIKKDALALPKGNLMTPPAMGYLTGLGITHVSVTRMPIVSIISTGKELIQAGQTLEPGQVYESNSISLKAALQKLRIQDITTSMVDDDVDALAEACNHAIETSDLVLITGGVSVGDYDFVLPALSKCGVEGIFHKVKQRPGKPLFFGKKSNKIIFGLPGNPSSVLSCFYQYVLIALQQMTGRQQAYLKQQTVPLKEDFSKNTSLTHFLKGYYDTDGVSHLTAQESFRLSSFALANCLIEIPDSVSNINKGESVTIYIIQ